MVVQFVPGLPIEKEKKAIFSHNKFVASAKVVQYAHEFYPDFKIGCMVAGVFSYPLTCDPKDVICNMEKMQNYFYCDGDIMARDYYLAAKRLGNVLNWMNFNKMLKL